MLKGKKYKVLLVDDDKFLVDMYSVKFKEGGLDVQVVLSAQDALDLIKKEDYFDVIVMDLIMPGMDGVELLENIRKANLAENSALIVLSNQSQTQDIEKVQKYGVDGYIIKASTIPSEVLSRVIKIADDKFQK